jgi:pSer/pThr/pTyr-binding forkhead associated (FHA) protein
LIVKLIVVSGKSAGRSIAVKRSKFLIGRADECDIRPLSEEVSRRHCAIIVGPESVFVEDLGSRNGTFVNGERIAERTQVTDGDAVRVGSLELRVSCTRQAAAGSDDDVSKWLMNEADAGDTTTTTRTLAAHDPRPGDAAAGGGDDDTIAGSGTGSVAGAAHGGTEGERAAAPGTPATRGDSTTVRTAAAEAAKASRAAPAGLPQQPSKSDSSKDAAAEALKKFFDSRS